MRSAALVCTPLCPPGPQATGAWTPPSKGALQNAVGPGTTLLWAGMQAALRDKGVCRKCGSSSGQTPRIPGGRPNRGWGPNPHLELWLNHLSHKQSQHFSTQSHSFLAETPHVATGGKLNIPDPCCLVPASQGSLWAPHKPLCDQHHVPQPADGGSRRAPSGTPGSVAQATPGPLVRVLLMAGVPPCVLSRASVSTCNLVPLTFLPTTHLPT